MKNSKFENFVEKGRKTVSEFGYEVKDKGSKVWEWSVEHPQEAITLAVGIVTVTTGLLNATKSLVVTRRMKIENDRQDMRFWDPHTRMHFDLKRKLTNKDRSRILDMQQSGMRIDEILRVLNLIK